MAIKMPPKTDLTTENQESDAWIKEGKKADDKAVDKKLRKQQHFNQIFSLFLLNLYE